MDGLKKEIREDRAGGGHPALGMTARPQKVLLGSALAGLPDSIPILVIWRFAVPFRFLSL
jgi:hypothetical protein